jgi:hypothetical protein
VDEPVFEGGFPAKITPEDFRRWHLDAFPRLADEKRTVLIQQAIDAVYTVFYGVSSIWRGHPADVWYEKTRVCYRLLTAWYLADMYPKYVSGMPVMGGLPVKRKKIGGVDLTFQDTVKSAGGRENLLAGLESNAFGKMARLMISASAARNGTWNTLWA